MAANVDGSEIAYIAVGVLLGTAIIAAFIAQIVIAIGYWRGNRTNNSLGLSGGEYARKLLDHAVLCEPFYSETIIVSPKERFISVCVINKPGLTAVYSESVKAGQRERAAEHV